MRSSFDTPCLNGVGCGGMMEFGDFGVYCCNRCGHTPPRVKEPCMQCRKMGGKIEFCTKCDRLMCSICSNDHPVEGTLCDRCNGK